MKKILSTFFLFQTIMSFGQCINLYVKEHYSGDRVCLLNPGDVLEICEEPGTTCKAGGTITGGNCTYYIQNIRMSGDVITYDFGMDKCTPYFFAPKYGELIINTQSQNFGFSIDNNFGAYSYYNGSDKKSVTNEINKTESDASSQTIEIYNFLNNGKELVFNSESKGCLTIKKTALKQSYSVNCDKPIDFSVKSLRLVGAKIELNLVMHYYGDVNLFGVIETQGEQLIFSYGENMYNRSQIDKYKLKAIESKLQEMPKNVTELLNLANESINKGDEETAQKYLNFALTIEPMNKKIYLLLGETFIDLGYNEKAEEAYRKAIEIDPNDSEALYQLGAHLVNWAGDIQTEAANLDYKNPNVAELDKKANEILLKGSQVLEKYVEKNPNEKSVLEILYKTYYRLGDAVKANLYKKRADELK